MKAILCEGYGPPSSLHYVEVREPTVAADEVLIQVKACGVNFPDTLLIQNKYQLKPTLPFSPGGEVAGVITKIGEKITYLKPGNRVLALCRWGGFAEYVAVKQNRVFVLPPTINFESAAASFYTLATAFHAFKDRANLKPGEKVLILGAAGGVGLAAIALGKMMGATVLAAASSDEKLNLARQQGADYLVNYTSKDWRESVKEITGEGVDVVFDPVGGTLAETALRSVAWRGRYLVVGFASGIVPSFAANIPLLKGASIVGVFFNDFSEKEAPLFTQNMQQLLACVAEGKLPKPVFQSYSLKQVPQALQNVMDRKAIGKAIIRVSEDYYPVAVEE